MDNDDIILVDIYDNVCGIGNKMDVHRKAFLHRAFSIFIFNAKNQLLLQKRLKTKYHSGGLWTNTCCSHPRFGESLEGATHRRLKEEMGIDCELRKLLAFVYKVEFENGLWEHEFDHVFSGHYNGNPLPNPEEVEDWAWKDVNEIQNDIENNPNSYTYWLKLSLPMIIENGFTKAQAQQAEVTLTNPVLLEKVILLTGS